jgi:3-oxoacyl-(acyl-carrier-protein) synthase/phosphopantetheinyl transferase
MKDNDIAIVGMSCYFPGAKNLQEFWHNLVNGVSSITDVPENRINSIFFTDEVVPDVDRFYFNKGAFVSPIKIDPLRYGILPIAAAGIDPEQLAALHLVKEALTDAGVYKKNIPLQKCCFILGKGNYSGVASIRIGSYTYFTAMLESVVKAVFPDVKEEEVKMIRDEYQAQLGRFQADTVAGAMPNMVVSLVANKFNLRGPAYTIDGACASSILAVEHAANLLLSGQCDIAVTGGMHLGQGAAFWAAFNVIRAASFTKQIAPFSEDADGMLIGEGAGILVLKKLDKAIADNDRIYAVIKACSTSSDGSDVSVMAPSSKGQIETLKLAWDRAGMDPKKIGYIETHGTATQVGDRVEIATLTEFFGDNTAPPALLGSVKSNIGHAMPAAGIAGLIKTALALYHRQIPPTLHCAKPMKAMYDSRFLPVQQLTDWDEKKYPLIAAVNAFGFGGINTHAILEPYFEPEQTTASAIKTELLNDKESIEIAETSSEKQDKLLVPLDFSYVAIREYPTVLGMLSKYTKKIDTVFSATSAFSEEEMEDPILQEVNNNLREIVDLQEYMLKWYRSNTSGSHPAPVTGINLQRAGNTIEKTIRFDLKEHPYLLDHMIVRQPNNRPLEELNPVVPFAMTIETLCELTQELVPGKKIIGVSSSGVQKWIPVKEPFVETMTGQWKTDSCILWTLPGYAYGEITIGDTYPAVPEEYKKEIDLGDNILPKIPKKDLVYSFFLFHEPRYQSIIEVIKLTKTGLHARIHKTEGKGSLLDNLGQLLGLFCHLTLNENQTTFPMSVDEIIFYQDFQDQKGVFDYTLVIKEVKDHEAISKVVIKRGGKIWCVVNGWHNRRVDYSLEVMNVVIRPKQFILSKNLYSNVYYYYYDPQMKMSVMEFLLERYLNMKERNHYRSLYPNQARDFLISRIALKDGVRKYLQKNEDEELIFPIEISVQHDEKGKPYLFGHEKLAEIEVSIAHKGSESVVMVSDKPVGIDIEIIEAKNKEFMNIAFTPYELDLLKEKGNEAEWIARFWVAKEAYGKMLGLGLQGNPKQYEIKSVSGEDLIINNRIIKTAKHRNNFIIGWTI